MRYTVVEATSGTSTGTVATHVFQLDLQEMPSIGVFARQALAAGISSSAPEVLAASACHRVRTTRKLGQEATKSEPVLERELGLEFAVDGLQCRRMQRQF